MHIQSLLSLIRALPFMPHCDQHALRPGSQRSVLKDATRLHVTDKNIVIGTVCIMLAAPGAGRHACKDADYVRMFGGSGCVLQRDTPEVCQDEGLDDLRQQHHHRPQARAQRLQQQAALLRQTHEGRRGAPRPAH